MNNLEIRHEIAIQRAALLELIHRLERLHDACVTSPPREVIHTRRAICSECGSIGPDDEMDNLPPPRIDVFGTMIRVTPTESEIMRVLLKHVGKPASWDSLRHVLYGSGSRPAGARKEYVDSEQKNLSVYITRLRSKLREAKAPAQILGHRGFGVELRSNRGKGGKK